MNKFFAAVLTAIFSITFIQACTKDVEGGANDPNLPGQNTTPAELMETEWLTSKFAVWNSYRIYHNGEFYNRQTQEWYSGLVYAAALDPDGGTGIYFGNKRFVSTIVSSLSTGGGCRTNNAYYTEGIPEFKDNKLILHCTYQRGISKSVCSPGGNYDKEFPTKTEEYTWAVGTEADSDGFEYYTLMLTDKENNTHIYYRRK